MSNYTTYNNQTCEQCGQPHTPCREHDGIWQCRECRDSENITEIELEGILLRQHNDFA